MLHCTDVGSGMSTSHKKSNFIFGVRKRQKVHSVPLAFSDSYKSYLSTKARIEVRKTAAGTGVGSLAW